MPLCVIFNVAEGILNFMRIVTGAEHHKTIYTIGHSTRSMEDFIRILQSFNIQLLVDIRRFPGSRKFPHFNKELLKESLQDAGINYVHLESLGGRRKVSAISHSAWKNPSFASYADYMQTPEFKKGIEDIEALANQQTTAYMCSEAVWWRCHRALVSDYLKTRGWVVEHIMDASKFVKHPFTSVAKVVQGKLFYGNEEE